MAKVLIIDDDVDLVEVLRLTLEYEGYEVIDAQDGETGYNRVVLQRPDIIILDVMMGTINEGFEVAERLEKNAAVKDIPVIMLTAVGQELGFKMDNSEKIIPVNEFIEKPVMPEDLLEIIKQYVKD